MSEMPVSTRRKSQTSHEAGRKPAGQAGSGAKSAMDEMIRRSGKPPANAPQPSAGPKSEHPQKKQP
jgi:hypothetical protein